MIVILTEWFRIQEIEPKDYGFLQEMEVFVKSIPAEDPLDVERMDLLNKIKEQVSTK